MSISRIGLIGSGFGGLGSSVTPGVDTPRLRLSSATIPDTTASGGTVGTLSVTNGSGSYTYSLTSNPDTLFSISGADLKTASALTAGSYPITVQADNGVDAPISRAFLITVTQSEAPDTGYTAAYISQGIF